MAGYSFLIYLSYLVFAVQCNKEYRRDYTYSSRTDAFYKLHPESERWKRAKDVCYSEGAELMLPSYKDLVQVHGMFKQYPDIGIKLWLGEENFKHDEQKHELQVNEFGNQDYDETNEGNQCNVMNRKGEIDTADCNIQIPFVCRVSAKEAKYDKTCNVFSDGYEYNATVGSCYKWGNIPMTWGQAQEECINEGGYLAIINSVVENQAIMAFLGRKNYHTPQSHHTSYALLGFRTNREDTRRIFKTVLNQTLSDAGFDEWSVGEPNNYRNSEYCGSIYRDDGKLNDVNCYHRYGYVCENEAKTP